jgi:starch phosphorylase
MCRGKRVLQQIAQRMRDRQFGDRFVFIEDYDINVGRHLVPGIDVWFNNPAVPSKPPAPAGRRSFAMAA